MASDPALSAPREHQPGDSIDGRYVLQHKLGEGGMGVVWVARSSALDVDVALKVLKPELAGTEAVERMAREARTAAQLGHPAMVRVLDFGTSEHGEPYLAMELLEGEELHERLVREGRLTPATAVALLLPVIDGLGTAHEKGIVHRDVKPENIFIATDGQHRTQPKVLDFGIAKLSQDAVPSRLTQVGAVMGSPFYLSPEQAEGLEDIDFRSDIWAVGIVLYELVTGSPPFAANNYNAQIRSILRDTPKPITELGVGDQQLWLIIDRCLKKDRAERWASIWELGEALALWLFERGGRVDASARSLRHGWLDGTATGVQILVSQVPGAESRPPVRALERTPAETAREQQLAVTHLRPRRRWRRQRGVLIALTAIALSVAGAAASYPFWGPAKPPPHILGAEKVAPATVAQEVVSPAVTEPVPSADAAASAPAPDATPAAAPARAASGEVSSRAAAKPRTSTATPVRKSNKAPTVGQRVPHNTEFGF
jgi:serine/threonine-protein kinase